MKHIKGHVHLRFPFRFACFPLKSKNSDRCVAIFIRALRLNNRNNGRIGKIMDHNSYYTILQFSSIALFWRVVTRLMLSSRYTCPCSLFFRLLEFTSVSIPRLMLRMRYTCTCRFFSSACIYKRLHCSPDT